MLRIICVLITLASVAHAQPLPGNNAGAGAGLNLADHMLIIDSKKAMKVEEKEVVDGTPYLTEEFQNGKVITSKGVYNPVMMRYNIHGDYIEFKQKDATFILDPLPEVQSVSLHDRKFIVGLYQQKGKSLRGYFIVLDSGKITLLEKKKVILHPPQAPKALDTEGRPARYEKQNGDYYYRIGNGAFVELVSVKKMIEGMPDHHEELTKFANKEKISRNEKELAQLVKYYNQLE